jgi:hypothetical protein
MVRKRLYNEARNLVMTLFILLTTAILISKILLSHLPPWFGVMYMSPCFLAYFAGRFFHRKRPAYAILAGIATALALSAVPISLAYSTHYLQIIAFILIPILTFVLFIMLFITGPNPVGSGRFMSGLAIFAAAILSGGAHAENYKAFLNATAIIFLVAGLFTFNRENLRDAAKQDPRSSKWHFPPGMRRSNTMMLVCMVGLGFILANIEKLKIFVIEAAKFVVRTFFAILYYILKLLGGGGGPAGGDTGGDPLFMGGEARTPNPIIEMIVRIIVIIVIVVASILVAYLLFKGIRKFIHNLPAWLERLLSKLMAGSEDGYIDETEDLLGRGELRKELMKNFSDFWNRITYRPPKFEDMPDNRAKVRFVFRHLLKRLSEGKHHLLSRTPNELTEEANRVLREDSRDFIEAYNRARYDSRDIPDEDAQLARKILRKL